MYCEHCGKKQYTNEKFCTECGKQYPEFKTNQSKTSNMDASLIIGIVSCVLIFLPVISIPVAITSLIVGTKNKKQLSNLIPAIISLVLSIIEIIIIIFISIFIYNQIESDSNEPIIEEDYYYEQSENYDISGYNWIGDDSSILYLNKNKNYIWYQSEATKETNYYQGTYEAYNGNDAILYIAQNLQEYGLTEDQQQKNIIESNHSINEYYLIKLICEKMIINGTEQMPTYNVIYYYGYYEEETGYLNLTNMNTNNKAGFTKENKSNIVGINKNFQI